MSRSRLVFFLIIGGALIVVLIAAVVLPTLQSGQQTQAATATAQNTVTLRVVYGTEKERWFTDAINQFQAANPGIKIDAFGQGSMESYQVLSGLKDSSTLLGKDPIPVLWSPASFIQVNLLNTATKAGPLNRDLAINCKPLVLSPLVIMVWEDRAKVFEAYYKNKGGITLTNLYDALTSKDVGGLWSKLGGSDKWGLIKIGHTDPQKSNSGIMFLIALANNVYSRTAPIQIKDITDAQFTSVLSTLENSEPDSRLISSTGVRYQGTPTWPIRL